MSVFKAWVKKGTGLDPWTTDLDATTEASAMVEAGKLAGTATRMEDSGSYVEIRREGVRVGAWRWIADELTFAR